MEINYYNINIEKDLNIPKNIEEKNNEIVKIIDEQTSLNILFDDLLLEEIIKRTNDFAKSKKHFIVFGTGGSNLGARAIINILNSNSNKSIKFYDNIDPIVFENSFNNIDFSSTGFVIISKSGSTSETFAQYSSIIELASKKNVHSSLFSNSLVITEFKDSPLFNLAKKNNCILFEHNKKIGGRYSIFSNVGLVPAILANANVKSFYNGATSFLNHFKNKKNLLFAQFFMYQNNLNISNNVIMTYSDLLYYFGKWYLQLWAESIGKNNKGITPIHAIGTTDQHSQLQLYLDGPKDKFFTFVTTNHEDKGLLINKTDDIDDSMRYLQGKKMGDLMNAEQKATLDTFNQNSLKFRNIFMPKIDEEKLGYLMAMSIVETISACIYFDVNPFNQPAVEQGKILTKKYLI